MIQVPSSINQEMFQKMREEIHDCFLALDLLKAVSRLVLLCDIIHSPTFSRMRELSKYNGVHNSYSGILQPSTKKKNWARRSLQLRINTLQVPTVVLISTFCVKEGVSYFYHQLHAGCFSILLLAAK